MTTLFVISIIVEIIIGICNYWADYLENIGQKAKTACNKYKYIQRSDGTVSFFAAPRTGLYGFYHKLYGLEYKEAYPLSATFLSFRTNTWSLLNAIRTFSRIIFSTALFVLLIDMSFFAFLWLLPFFVIVNFLTFTIIRIFLKKDSDSDLFC